MKQKSALQGMVILVAIVASRTTVDLTSGFPLYLIYTSSIGLQSKKNEGEKRF